MPAWALVTGGGDTDGDWFAQRFTRARALATAAGVSSDANFDTIIPAEFAETVTCELVDVVGVADANPETGYNGGVVGVTVGDAVEAPNSCRLQLTSPPSHVGSLSGKMWYIASLVRVMRPEDDNVGDSAMDAIGLWGDDNNRVGLGIMGNASGGSATNWVGYVVDDSSFTTVLGPALDGEESPVWHLFEAWFIDDELHFAIDGEEFEDTIAAAALPAVAATLSMILERDTAGDPVAANYDKACVIVRSPVVGETS